jgi:hypothetical protein
VTAYLLDPMHPKGRSKAAFFHGIGFESDRPDELRKALLEVAAHTEMKEISFPYGRKYTGVGSLRAPNGMEVAIRTVWVLVGWPTTGSLRYRVPRTREEVIMSAESLKELDLAALRRDLPDFGLVAGDIGTVLLVYGNGEAYEVEFVAADGETIALETLRADEVAPVVGHEILHARKLPAA